VQANELGINSIGYDVSAFNVMLTRAKTAHYDIPQLKREVRDILVRLKEHRSPDLFKKTLTRERLGVEANNYLTAWFAPQALTDLLAFRSLIGDYENKDFFNVVLSRAARSARRTTHFDLDFPKKPQLEPYFCYKHSRMCAPTSGSIQFIERYTLDALKRVVEFAEIRTSADVAIHHADSRTGDFCEIDGVITSPPYVGLIDYHEQHTYAYQLLGLHDQRGLEIGAAAKGSSIQAKRTYQEEIASVFTRAAQSLRPGGRIIVVVGDRANLYPEIASMVGLQQEATVQRHVNRRTGRRSNDFYESVLVWRKQIGSLKNGGTRRR
jgi:hypothetical protein